MEIGFLPISIWDILDILVVGFLMYQIYRLLRGSVAFNIFIGVILLYILWWLVGALKMELLSLILGQFVSVGVIILIIIFQPEVRKFLLYLGNTTLRRRSGVLDKLFGKDLLTDKTKERKIKAIQEAMQELSRLGEGVLIVMAGSDSLETAIPSGTVLEARISKNLLIAIFQKQSPLHDGAVLIRDGKVFKARCILPVSESRDLPARVGLRHRAAVGITENADVAALVVSEENGGFSYAYEGQLYYNISDSQLLNAIKSYY